MMIDENSKKEIETAFFTAFDRWGQRYFENLFKILKSGETEEAKQAYQRAFEEQSFLEKRVFNLGFYRFIVQEITSSNIILRQRRVLLKACLSSIASGSGMKMEDVLKKASIDLWIGDYDGREDRREMAQDKAGRFGAYHRRNMQQFIHGKYKETFFEINTDADHNSSRMGKHRNDAWDKRFSYFATVFSPYDLPVTPETEEVEQYSQIDRLKVLSDTYRLDQLYRHSMLRFVMPEFIEDMLKFKKECEDALIELGIHIDIVDYLRSELTVFSDLLCYLYSHLTSILALEYFRHRKTEGKKLLLDREFTLKYTRKDAAKARELLLKLTGSNKEKAFDILSLSALAFQALDLPQYAVFLYEQCKKLEGLTPAQIGVSCEHAAVIYRNLGKFKLMLLYSKEALENFKTAGNTYLTCIALRDIGEAEWMLGFKELAMKYFMESEMTGNKLDPPAKRADVLGNIAYAFRRIGEKRLELNYLKKCLIALPEEETKKILNVDIRIAELTRTIL